uniref:Uncharacterized protein n=1 Tax=Anguilla anguilla TaxID=7936 RepID=A0A0E9XR77_ANGAN
MGSILPLKLNQFIMKLSGRNTEEFLFIY